MIQAIIIADFEPYTENPDEAILEGNLECNKIIREIGKSNKRFKNIKFNVKIKRDKVDMDDLRSIDEARELRMMHGTADETDEKFV